ncbi:hypothetical protein [Pseudoalteromonas xiamenensis]
MRVMLSFFMLCLTSCGGGTSQSALQPAQPVKTPIFSEPNGDFPLQNNQGQPPYSIVFFGNSHSTNIPTYLSLLFKANNSLPDVTIQRAPSIAFLSERLYEQESIDLLYSRRWTHAIFQAQKYSQSSSTTYPTTAAELWIKRARSLQATPVLYPEHPQQGNTDEGQQLQSLHIGIASRSPACIAPVGLVWDEFQIQYPNIVLHETDGNHANIAGHILTSLVFYHVITGLDTKGLPAITELPIDNDVFVKMKNVVDFIVAHQPLCYT